MVKALQQLIVMLAMALASTVSAGILVNKNFVPATINVGATSTLVIVVSNNVPSTATSATLADDFPSGIFLASPIFTNNCLGTVTNAIGGVLSVGDTGIRMSDARVPPGTPAVPVSCTLGFVVTSVIPSQSLVNTIPVGSVTTSLGNNPDPATATLNTNPIGALVVAKTVAPAFVHGGGTAVFVISVTNSNLLSATFSLADNLPQGLSLTNVVGITNSCGAALVNNGGGPLADNDSGFRIDNAFLPPRIGANNGSCSISFTVTAWDAIAARSGNLANTIPANITNSLAAVSAAVTRNLSVQSGGAATKSFVPNTVVVPGTSTLTINLSNRNLSTVTGATVTDSLPAFTFINGPASASPSCGLGIGFTTNAGGALIVGSTSIRINNADIPPSDNSSQANAGVCVVTVEVLRTAEGTSNNNIAAGSFGPGLPNFTSTGNVPITGIADITGTKVFLPATRVAGGTTTLVISLTNNSVSPAAAVLFTDNLLSMSALGSFTIAAPAVIASNCGGSVTISVSLTSFRLSNGFIPAAATCQISLPIAITNTLLGGNYVNTLPAGTVSSSVGTNTVQIQGTLVVVDPLVVTKAYAPTVIPANTTAQLTITLTRRTANGAPDLTNLAFTDTLPPGQTVASPAGVQTNCGGVASASSGANTVTLAGGLLSGAATTCIVRVNVLATITGTNTFTVAAITTNEGITNRVRALATLTVGGTAPNFTLNKDFTVQSIVSGAVTRMQITINNNSVSPPSVALSSLSFQDVFPDSGGTAAFVIQGSPAPAVSGTGCTVGSYSAVAGSNTFAVFGAAVPAGGSCIYSVNVTGYITGSHNNQITSSTAISAQGATNSNSAQKTLNVSSALNIGKSFYPELIQVGQASTLTIAILNTTNAQLTGTYPSFIDVMPAQITITSAPTTNCTSATVAGITGSRTITFSSGVIPALSQCSIFVPVTSNQTGTFVNTIPAGSATFFKPGSGTELNASAANASLSVLDKPSVTKTFAPVSIGAGGTSMVVISIRNGNTAAQIPGGLSGVSVSDNLSGMSVFGSQPASGNCGNAASNLIANGATVVSLTGLTVAPASTCTVGFIISPISTGILLNTTTGINSAEVPPSGVPSNVAALTVFIRPAISKSFGTDSLALGETTTLTVTLFNSNPAAITLSTPAFTDIFPLSPGQMVLTSTVATSSCISSTLLNSGGGALTVGNIGIRLDGGAMAANSQCSVSVVVSGPQPGTYTNVTSALQSTNAGASTMTGSAQLVYAQPTADLRITKTNSVSSLVAGTTTSYTITVANFGPYPANDALLQDPVATGLVCTAIACVNASGGAVCPTAGVAPFLLSLDNLQVNGIKLSVFPAGGQLSFKLDCGVTATGR